MVSMKQGPGFIPLCRASALLPFVRFSETIGAPVRRQLADCGLSLEELEAPEALFPLARGFGFAARVARDEGLEHLGFIVGMNTAFQELGAFGRFVLQSDTLHDALGKISGIIQLYNSAQRIWLEQEEGRTLICTAYHPQLDEGWRFGEQFTLTLLINCIRVAAGRTWLPLEIRLAPAIFDLIGGKADMLGMPVTRSRTDTALVVESALLRVPMERLLREGPGTAAGDFTALAQSAPPTDFTGSVAYLSRMSLADQLPPLEGVAAAMGVSVRTLQRRLADHGVEFSAILDGVRREQAMVLMRDGTRDLTGIALDLGYSDVTSFSRAFRRWTGVPPGRFRRQQPS
jgi:AraC-like DNA-binding protein